MSKDKTPREVLEQHGWTVDLSFEDIGCFEAGDGRVKRHVVIIDCGSRSIEPISGAWQVDEQNQRVFSARVAPNAHGPDVLRVLAEYTDELADLVRRWQGTNSDGFGNWDWSGIDVHFRFELALNENVRTEWEMGELLEWWLDDGEIHSDTNAEDQADGILMCVGGDIVLTESGGGTYLDTRSSLIDEIEERIEHVRQEGIMSSDEPTKHINVTLRLADADELTIGDVIRVARARQGISQTKLAKYVGITQSKVSEYESGTVMPGAGRFCDIVRALVRISPSDRPAIERDLIKLFCGNDNRSHDHHDVLNAMK